MVTAFLATGRAFCAGFLITAFGGADLPAVPFTGATFLGATFFTGAFLATAFFVTAFLGAAFFGATFLGVAFSGDSKTDLGKVLYIADKCELGRDYDSKNLIDTAINSLDLGFKAVKNDHKDYLEKRQL